VTVFDGTSGRRREEMLTNRAAEHWKTEQWMVLQRDV